MGSFLILIPKVIYACCVYWLDVMITPRGRCMATAGDLIQSNLLASGVSRDHLNTGACFPFAVVSFCNRILPFEQMSAPNPELKLASRVKT